MSTLQFILAYIMVSLSLTGLALVFFRGAQLGDDKYDQDNR